MYCQRIKKRSLKEFFLIEGNTRRVYAAVLFPSTHTDLLLSSVYHPGKTRNTAQKSVGTRSLLRVLSACSSLNCRSLCLLLKPLSIPWLGHLEESFCHLQLKWLQQSPAHLLPLLLQVSCASASSEHLPRQTLLGTSGLRWKSSQS